MGRWYRGAAVDEQQICIFSLVLNGHSSTTIANQLGLDHARVERIIRVTRQQLGVSSRHQAALIIADQHGWSRHTVNGHSIPVKSHFEPMGTQKVSKSANTLHKNFQFSHYVREVESKIFNKGTAFDDFDGERIVNSVKSLLDRSRIMQCFALILLIICTGALALSALISALHGFDKLIQS